jgi:hypothetical protein
MRFTRHARAMSGQGEQTREDTVNHTFGWRSAEVASEDGADGETGTDR